MQLRRLSFCASFAAAVGLFPTLLFPTPASAHTVLVNPEPLQTNDNAKEPACGCTFGGGLIECPADYQITPYEPGASVMITWNETIDHDGEFRVAFVAKPPDQVTDADFEEAEIQVTLIDDQAGGLMDAMLTLPTTPCAECTIQVRQLMVGADAPYYYTCAAISIGSGPGEGGSPASGGSGEGAGSGEGGTTSGPGGGEIGRAGGDVVWAGPETGGGCTISAGNTASGGCCAAWLPALGLALAIARRGGRSQLAARR